jgi:hypothetical protein
MAARVNYLNQGEKMMRRNEALPSKYLNAADVGQNVYKLVIASVVMEKMENDGVMKPVMYFNNAQKAMVVNATNWENMSQVYEDESNNWVGKTIEMYTEATRMPNGTAGRGIRIRPMADAVTGAAFAQGAERATPDTQAPLGPGEEVVAQTTKTALGEDISDEIPW